MIPAAFDYEVAESVEHAVELLGTRDDAKLLAGGHSLLPLLKLRVARPSLLVDVGRLDGAELRPRRRRHARDRRAHAPPRPRDRRARRASTRRCSRHAAAQIGDPQVRHRGTIGGSVAHGDPASDLPAVPARPRRGDARRRRRDRAVRPGGRLLQGRVHDRGRAAGDADRDPRPQARRLAARRYVKFSRRAQDWATVGVAVVLENGGGAIALANMGPTPLRARTAEAALAEGAVAAGRRRPRPGPRRRRRRRRAPSSASTSPACSRSARSSRPWRAEMAYLKPGAITRQDLQPARDEARLLERGDARRPAAQERRAAVRSRDPRRARGRALRRLHAR